MLYFLADFTHKGPINMVLLDSEEQVVGVEHLSEVKGKFGPGAINHSLFKEK